MSKFKDVFRSLSHKINNILLQEYVLPPPAPTPAATAAATSLTKSQERAISQIIGIASNDWLSNIQIDAFQRDNTLSKVFLIFPSSKEMSTM